MKDEIANCKMQSFYVPAYMSTLAHLTYEESVLEEGCNGDFEDLGEGSVLVLLFSNDDVCMRSEAQLIVERRNSECEITSV
jgi:hypothetical protein